MVVSWWMVDFFPSVICLLNKHSLLIRDVSSIMHLKTFMFDFFAQCNNSETAVNQF